MPCTTGQVVVVGRVVSTVSAFLTAGLLTVLFALAAVEIDSSPVHFPHPLPLIASCFVTAVVGISFIIMIVASWIKFRQLRIALIVLHLIFGLIAVFVTVVFLFQTSILYGAIHLFWTSQKIDGVQRVFENRAVCCGWAEVEARCTELSSKTCETALGDLHDFANPFVSALAIVGFLGSIAAIVLTIVDLRWKPSPVENDVPCEIVVPETEPKLAGVLEPVSKEESSSSSSDYSSDSGHSSEGYSA
jgi:hypothetical protein